MGGARRPPRCLASQCLNHGLPIVESLCRQQLTKRRHPGTMAEQLTQGNGLLVGLGKLRPIARYWNIQGQLTLAYQLQGSHGGEHLGAGKQIGNRVAVPGLGAVLVGGTRPEVNDGLPADLNAQRRATLLRIVEQRSKGFAHSFKLKLVMTLNLHPATPRTCRNRKWRALFQPATLLGTHSGQTVTQPCLLPA
ncbi:hypothetical protein D3C72_1258370 [compost metagenome]